MRSRSKEDVYGPKMPGKAQSPGNAFVKALYVDRKDYARHAYCGDSRKGQ